MELRLGRGPRTAPTGAGPAAVLVLVALAYAAGSLTAFYWFNAEGGNASFFPAAGVTLAALVIAPTRLWPFVLAGALTAEMTVDLAQGIALAPTAGYALANLVEPLAGALLLRRYAPRCDLQVPRDLAAFVACAAVSAPALGGVIGATTNVLFDGGTNWARFAGQWWIGDGLGVLVVAGAALALRGAAPDRRLGRLALVESAALVVGAIAVTTAVFWFEQLPLGFAALSLLVWIAFRVGTAGVALAGAGMAFMAAEATAEGHDFWDLLGVSPATGLVYLQLLLAIMIVSSLALAAEIRERERSLLEWGRAEAARHQALHHAERASALADITEAVLLLEDDVATAAAVLERGLRPLRPAAGAVYVSTGSGSLRELVTRALDLDPREIHDLDPDSSAPHRPPSFCPPSPGRPARAILPLRRAGRGVLVVQLAGSATFDEADREYLVELAGRADLALERSWLQRAQAEAHRRTALLQKIAERVAVARTAREVAEVVAAETMAVFGARRGVVVALDADGEPSLLGAAGYSGEERRALTELLRTGALLPVTHAYRNGVECVLASRSDWLRHFPELERLPHPPEGALAVPLEAKGRRLGAIAWGFAHESEFDGEMIALARAIASQCALALERSRLADVEHRFVEELQRAMLPDRAVLPQGVEVAARYVGSLEELEVGGDWYDVIDVGHGRVAFAIGDVVGRGLRASVAMGQLRSAVRALSGTTTSPAEVLEHLDRFAEQVEGARYSTACYAVLDLASGTLRYAAAAHLPPLVAHDGAVYFLDDGRSPPLCASPGLDRKEASATLPAGAMLVLYTDGLIERRGEALDEGFARLASLAAAGRELDGEQLADSLLENLLAGEAVTDDAAVVLVHYRPHAGLTQKVPAHPRVLRDLRAALRGWLEREHVEARTAGEIVLACGEALGNAVEHAYARTGNTAADGTLELLGERCGDTLRLTVRDDGCWRSPGQTADRGRGFTIMKALSDTVDVTTDGTGTTVTITKTVVRSDNGGRLLR